MHPTENLFDNWLKDRLTASGVLGGHVEDDDVHAAIERYQQASDLPVTGLACERTCIRLRRRKSNNPESPLIFFDAVPPCLGSQYAPAEARA